MDCLFCKIVNNEIPSYTVYEDENFKVFLDINPSTNGDMLLIPKKHYENLFDLDKDLILKMYDVINNIYALLKEKLNIDGLTLVQNNFYGQEIKHFHIHLTPRYINDDVMTNSNKDLLKDIKDVFEIIQK